MTNQQKYLRAFLRGDDGYYVSEVYGRIARTSDEVPTLLAQEANRKLILIMGPSGLSSIVGESGYDALLKIGYTPDYIARNLARGMRFFLVVFQRPQNLRIATWKQTINAVANAYPAVAPLLHAALKELKSTSFAEFEQQAGFQFANLAADDRRFMTEQQLLNSDGSAQAVRRFLLNVLNFSDLFSGDGYTQTVDGQRGVREYLLPNGPLQSLRNCQWLELRIEIPA